MSETGEITTREQVAGGRRETTEDEEVRMEIGTEDRARTRELVEEVLRTALVLEDVMTALLEDLPEHVFPGEDNGEVLLQMVVGSITPAVAAAGEPDRRAAIGLVTAIRERVLADLHTAAEMAAGRPTDGPDQATGEGR
jgi:hypothetical protein